MLVATHPLPPPPRIYGDRQIPLYTTPLKSQFEVLSLEEKRLVTQLSHLASQHHASEYNRLKFGPRGAPLTYVPLSVQVPLHVKELQLRQATNGEKRAWWPSSPKLKGCDPICAEVEDRSLSHPYTQWEDTTYTAPDSSSSSTSVVMPRSLSLQQEISAAISSPLPSIFGGSMSIHQAKTSETHPINISMIVPLEFLPTISSHLIPAPQPSPVMFHLPDCYFLDRITTPSAAETQAHSSVPPRATVAQFFRSVVDDAFTTAVDIGPPFPGEFHHNSLSWPVSSNTDALRVETTENCHPIPFSPPPLICMTRSLPVISTSPQMQVRKAKSDTTPDIHFASSSTDRRPQISTKRLSRLRSRHERAFSAPPILPSFKPLLLKSARSEFNALSLSSVALNSSVSGSTSVFQFNPAFTASIPTSSIACDPSITSSYSLNTHFTHNNDWTDLLPGQSTSPTSPPMFSFSSPSAVLPPGIGNLFLSSCPGKKVRLSGPVRGRGAICRDLRQDLSRMVELGVGCIICCLDDDELDFLGASWSEYSEIARDLGLDVLRLPTPEGLAPLTPEALDAHLLPIITAYTLRDVPILVHCRGGVGRAGLVACCWLLKLGLCGWKDPQLCRPRTFSGEVCRATIQLVERAICAVRRRRSLKAVETYEQVKFLVDFVEYLDASSGHPTCRAGGVV